MSAAPYTTQLQAGLGLVAETKALLDVWSPEMTISELHSAALQSGRFPSITARRLRNIVSECFAPRYLVSGGAPARQLKALVSELPGSDFSQLLLVYTCRANPILRDFISEVYWERFAAGFKEISTADARAFVERAVDDGKTSKRWSETTIRRVSAYLTGCCADYGLLERGAKSKRKIIPFRISPRTLTYFAFELHFQKVPDNALLSHSDWRLFGLERSDVLAEMKRLAKTGVLVIQSAGEAVRISWKKSTLEELRDVLVEG